MTTVKVNITYGNPTLAAIVTALAAEAATRDSKASDSQHHLTNAMLEFKFDTEEQASTFRKFLSYIKEEYLPERHYNKVEK
jgi:hypothetical protein